MAYKMTVAIVGRGDWDYDVSMSPNVTPDNQGWIHIQDVDGTTAHIPVDAILGIEIKRIDK